MKLTQLIGIVWARRWLFIIVLTSTIGAATAFSLLKSKTYLAEVAVLVDAKNVDPVTGTALPQQMQSSVQATQADVISSHNVALKVVDKLQLAADPEAQRQFSEDGEEAGSIRDWLADKLRDKLTVRSSRDSNVISLDFEGRSPELAAQIANAFAEGYIQASLELRIDPAKRQAVWFDDQVQGLRKALESAQKRLSDYQQQRKIVGTDDRLDVENAKLNEISSQLVVAQGAMYDAESRQKQMSQALQRDQLEELPDILGNGLLQSLKADLVRAESKLAQVSQRYDRNHPENVSAAAEVQTLKSKLAAEIGTVQGSINQAAQLSRGRVAEAQQALEAQKQKVLALKQQRDGLDVLNREVENAQRAYDAGMQRTNELRLTSRLDQTNIAVLNPATPPAKPAGPKVLRNILLAVLAGAILGAAAALALELIDRRVRSSADLLRLSDAGALVVLAEIRDLSLAKPVKPRRRRARPAVPAIQPV
jgi:succinoglycan biosynthesis transport protein ExoP